MLTSFQYRLQQYESVPPAESWQNISLRLNEECHPEEIVISKKLTGYIQAPPADLWSAITAGLSQPNTSSEFIESPAQFGWPSSEPAFDALSELESSVKELALNEQATKELDSKEFAKRELAKQELAKQESVKRELLAAEPATKEPADSEKSAREISQKEYAAMESSSMEDVSKNENRPSRGRVIPFNWPRIAIAAAVLGVAISALYYFVSRDSTVRQLTAKTNPANGKADESKLPAVIPGNDEPLVSTRGTNMAITGGARIFRKRNKSELPVQQASYEPEITNADISYANINGTDLVASGENIAIPTQPIRDDQGNIIMDEKLISAPDVNYVTVTGPNGEQTKISKKFLHALSYMNAGSDDENIGIALQESALWKWLFKEWRQKLLTQPSFIPSTTNFLDIMELKEILHENF